MRAWTEFTVINLRAHVRSPKHVYSILAYILKKYLNAIMMFSKI
jgi:hypothetical protein